jgi:heptosyltransferase-3
LAAVRAARRPGTAPTLDLSGQLTLKELAALAARARLFVGVDSAPMHIAAAMGTPTIGIFGPSGDREWGPWGEGHRVVASLNHPCRPCGRAGCDDSKVSDCLTTCRWRRCSQPARSCWREAGHRPPEVHALRLAPSVSSSARWRR